MKRDRFINNGISYDVFWNPETTSKETGMYIYGFPGSIGENEITKIMLQEKLNVVQPHYPGTFDSDGKFSPESSYDFLNTLDSIMASGTINSTKKNRNISFGGNLKFAVGHSYGCFSLLRSLKYLPQIETIILFGPAITYTSHPNKETYTGLIEDGEKHFNYVSRSRPFTYRMDKKEKFDDLYNGLYDFLDLKNHSSLKNIIGIVGSKDSYFDIEILKNKYYSFLQKSVSQKVNIELIIIENGDHSIKSLLTSPVKDKIVNLIKGISK